MKRTFTIVLIPEPETEGYSVQVPVLPGVYTCGDTREEAIAMAREAIALFLDGMDEAEIPVESAPLEMVRVEPLEDAVIVRYE